MTDGFVEVYAKSTGAKQLVPEHWLDHPVLGRDFELTPSERAAAEQDAAGDDVSAGQPSEQTPGEQTPAPKPPAGIPPTGKNAPAAGEKE